MRNIRWNSAAFGGPPRILTDFGPRPCPADGALWHRDAVTSCCRHVTMFLLPVPRPIKDVKTWGIGMRNLLLAAGMAMALVGTTAAHAGTLSFDFSLSNDGTFVDGSVDGTVTGEVTGLTDNATSSATHVYIFSYPAGLGSVPAVPFDALSLADVESNTFTVSNGSITGGDFFAQQSGYPGVALLSDGIYNFLRTGMDPLITYNGQGLSGVTFTAVTTPVPEPSTWALTLIGFAGFGLVPSRLRRSRRQALA